MRQLSVISWNVQGKINWTGYTPFRKILPSLVAEPADIIALQEMCNAERILARTKAFDEYNIVIPEHNTSSFHGKPGFNQNVVFSKFPIVDVKEIIFPYFNTKEHLENATRVDLQIDDTILRIYNCHFTIFRAGIATRLNQFIHILEDAAKHNGPTIICGDLNAAMPKKGIKRKVIRLLHQEPKHEMEIDGKFIDGEERQMFYEILRGFDFIETPDLYTPTWSPLKSERFELFKLKLDWFMVKNLKAELIELGKYISDHRAIKTRVTLKRQKAH